MTGLPESKDKRVFNNVLVVFFTLICSVAGLSCSNNNSPVVITTASSPKDTPTAESSALTSMPYTLTPKPTETLIPSPTHASMISEKDGMTLLYVPAGEFTMGSNSVDQPDENPEHQVDLDAFWIDQTEVTNAMYAKCVADGKCALPSSTYHFKRPSYANHPVVFVNWNKANDYCSWAGRSLPTEAQWEKAARGTHANIYPWGNEEPNSDLLNFYLYVGGTTKVGSYESGKSFYGAYDMAGNVWEWVNDWYDVYPGGNTSASIDFGQKYRVLRGGSWSLSGYGIRSASRDGFTPVYTDSYVGFRCALSP